jgi:hypothetical protein
VRPVSGISALADEALGLGGVSGLGDGLELDAEGFVDGGTIERAGAVGDAAHRCQVIAVEEVEDAGGALDVGIEVVGEGRRDRALYCCPDRG